MSRIALFIVPLAGLAACAPAKPRPTQSPPSDVIAAASRPTSNRQVLTQAEIRAAVGVSDAYALVQKLRPMWLQVRGDPTVADSDGSREILVYYNGARAGGVSVLRQYEVSQLVSMRWVDPIAARSSYGGGHGRGVIAVHGR
jgi:hypothetical protein